MFAARKKQFCVKEHVFKLGCCSPETPRRNVSTVLMCLLMGKNVYTDCVCVCVDIMPSVLVSSCQNTVSHLQLVSN